MNILAKLGLMKVSEHEAAVQNRMSIAIHNDVVDAFKEQLARKEAKYKAAITDLAAARDEVEAWEGAISAVKRDLQTSGARNRIMSRRIDDLLAELATLRPIAEKAIAKAARDAAAKRVKRGVGK